MGRKKLEIISLTSKNTSENGKIKNDQILSL